MSDFPLIEPKEVHVKLLKGGTKAFLISKVPSTVGRRLVTQYPVTAAPKIGDYSANEALMQELMSYVAVAIQGRDEPQRLTTMALIDNHVPDTEALLRLEMEMANYNTSFFAGGKGSTFLDGLASKVQALITKTLTDFSQSSSKKG